MVYKVNFLKITLALIFPLLVFCKKDEKQSVSDAVITVPVSFPFKGVSFVGGKNEVIKANIDSLANTNINYIAQMPFAHVEMNQANIEYDQNYLWWGETDLGISVTTQLAREQNIKTMLKPQLWINGAYTGIYELNNETDWLLFEKNYGDYILHFAHLADSLNIEMFCIGTELGLVVKNRPQFWNTLIDSIRTFYDGKLTYAANWDDYQKVTFWDKLDYIGVDGYFPLSTSETPSFKELNESWKKYYDELNAYQKSIGKKIIFTEIGYKSVHQCAFEPWNPQSTAVNLLAQKNAYVSFFHTFGKADWFMGCFLWKWYPNDANSGGNSNTDYTPQNKVAKTEVKNWFK